MTTHLKPFNENHTIKYFHTLRSTFWNDDNTINENYQHIQDLLLSSQNQSSQEHIKQSYQVLTNPKEKSDYITFLFYNYILSQPFSLYQLKTNFNNKLFPFYLFSFLYKGKVYMLTIDFISLRINYQYKYKRFKSISTDEIVFFMKYENSIYINALPQLTNIDLNQQKQILSAKSPPENSIIITPEFKDQLDLIYSLLLYLLKLSSQMKPTKENKVLSISQLENDNKDYYDRIVNNFDIIKDDVYIPSGVILKASVMKMHQKRMGKAKRYLVLGSSQLIIYRDESMAELCSVIPIIPYEIIFSFNDHTLMIQFILMNRTQNIFFNNVDEYTIWKSTLLDIGENKLIENIDDRSMASMIYESKGKRSREMMKEVDDEIGRIKEEIDKIKNRQSVIKSRMINVVKKNK